MLKSDWSGRRESNPRMQLGKLDVLKQDQSDSCKTAPIPVQSHQRLTTETQNLRGGLIPFDALGPIAAVTPIAAEFHGHFATGAGVANRCWRSSGSELAGNSPKAKVTRSNRVGCASFPDIAVQLSAECPRNQFAS